MASSSIDARLLAAQVAIDNALSDAEIKGYLADYGYDESRLNEGKALYETALQLHQKQKAEYGDQVSATREFKDQWKAAGREYMKFVKLARIALKSQPGALLKLDLNGERKKTFSGWLSQTKQFYINALGDSEVLTALAGFGITPEKLQAGQQLVLDTESANAAQEKEKGEAQQATPERDTAMDQLDEWKSDFTAVARIALEEKPQLLEKLGILERS